MKRVEIDEYLSGRLKGGQLLVFKAKMLLNEELRRSVRQQKLVMQVIRRHGKNKLSKMIRVVETELFCGGAYAAWQKKVDQIFEEKQ